MKKVSVSNNLLQNYKRYDGPPQIQTEINMHLKKLKKVDWAQAGGAKIKIKKAIDQKKNKDKITNLVVLKNRGALLAASQKPQVL